MTTVMGIRPRLWWKRFDGHYLACLFLVAFALQSYITQTHIEGWLRVGTDERAAPQLLGHGPAHDPAPGHRHPADCPFCQAVAHAGVFFGPMPPALFVPSSIFAAAGLSAISHAARRELAHIWQSRAPPQR